MRFVQKKIEDFAHELKGRKIIYCFGAGSALTRFLNEFHTYNLEDNIKYVVDNSREKQGTMVQGIKSQILIISLNRMLHEIKQGDVLLITTVHFPEIIALLRKEEKLKDIECYLYAALRIEQYDYDRLKIAVPEKLSTYRIPRIPKTIHYCWFGGKQIPAQYRVWMESWKKYCPDYEIVEWNENNYDVKKNKFLRQAYEIGKWAFVSDYARIDIVNEYGGIYLDTDVELIKNIDAMLMNDAFCGFETCQYVAYGLGFGAVRQNPILSDIKDYYDNLSFALEESTLNQMICPIVQTKIMKKHGLQCNGEFQVVKGMAVYPSRILCGMSPHSFRIQRDLEYTYTIHHFTGSWLGNMQYRNYRNHIISWMKMTNSDNYLYSYVAPDKK